MRRRDDQDGPHGGSPDRGERAVGLPVEPCPAPGGLADVGPAPRGHDGIGPAPSGRQLALPFAHRPRFERADFLRAPSNEAALRWLDRSAVWPQGRLALWGEAGSGKTHLLHVWAAEHDALLLPGTALRGWALERGTVRKRRWRAIAVDDADEATDEAALLHLLNAASEAGLPVLLTARKAPSRWNTALPDLTSRLRAIHSVPLGQPDEAMLRILLLRLLVERQLAVSPLVVDWMLNRLPRTAAAMRDAARALDEAALASGRRITRALAAAVLEDPPTWFIGEPGPDGQEHVQQNGGDEIGSEGAAARLF